MIKVLRVFWPVVIPFFVWRLIPQLDPNLFWVVLTIIIIWSVVKAKRKGKFYWKPFDATFHLIESWRPRRCESEKEYENSLYDFLHDKLPSVQIARQSGLGRTRADLVVGKGEVIIELKNNFNTPSKLYTLIGQIEEYRRNRAHIFIVLVGESEKGILKQLEDRTERYRPRWRWQKGFGVIEKK